MALLVVAGHGALGLISDRTVRRRVVEGKGTGGEGNWRIGGWYGNIGALLIVKQAFWIF